MTFLVSAFTTKNLLWKPGVCRVENREKLTHTDSFQLVGIIEGVQGEVSLFPLSRKRIFFFTLKLTKIVQYTSISKMYYVLPASRSDELPIFPSTVQKTNNNFLTDMS